MRYRLQRPQALRTGGFGYSGIPGFNSQQDPLARIPGSAPPIDPRARRAPNIDTNDPRLSAMSFAQRAVALGYQEYIPQTGIEDNHGDPFILDPQASENARTPMDPGIDTPGYVNPYRTVMYSITGLSTTVPSRVLTGNFRRTYLIIQNLGPGNMFVGIGTDPNAGGQNVLNLVATQIYEQIGGGMYLPPNPWYPDGVSLAFSFVSSDYIALMVDTAGTNAMVLEGMWSPPRQGSHP